MQPNTGKQQGDEMKVTVLLIAALISGCASTGANYVPLVDMQGHDYNSFAKDTQQCQAYARQRMDAASGAVAGAIIGALFMAAVSPRGYRNYSAGQGALVGAAGGAVAANDNQETIVKRCLAGRGYSVLN